MLDVRWRGSVVLLGKEDGGVEQCRGGRRARCAARLGRGRPGRRGGRRRRGRAASCGGEGGRRVAAASGAGEVASVGDDRECARLGLCEILGN